MSSYRVTPSLAGDPRAAKLMAAGEEQLHAAVDRPRRTAVVTIRRAAKLGALSNAVLTRLTGVLRQLGADEGVSCVILASAGRAFSAGNDVMGDTPPDTVARAAIAAVVECPVPVVAAVQGFAYTGALELLAAADIVVAAESAYFQDTHAQLGMVPTWGGNVRLPRKIGLNRAKELMFTSRKVGAREMQQWGLVNRVVPDAALIDEARSIADSIAANSRQSIEKQKRVMNEAWAGTQGEALAWVDRFHPGHAGDLPERLRALRKPKKGGAKKDGVAKL